MVACAAVAFLVGTPAAQPDINEAVTLEDLGFMNRLHVGARPAGMGGAYTSLGGDAHSLVYNPAGLAEVKRIDLSIGFVHQMNTVKSTFYGVDSEVDVSTSTLDYLSIAYPVPTYRGSLVLAGGVYRMWSSQFDLLQEGTNVSTQTQDFYRLQQSGSMFTYNFGLGIDLSPRVSAGFNLFFVDGTIKALTQFNYSFLIPGNPGELEREELVDDAQVDVDGYGATFGVQWRPLRVFRLAVGVTTPIPLSLHGDAYQEVTQQYNNSPDEFLQDSFIIDSDFQIPLRVDAGVGFSTKYLTLAADATYQDWGQTEIQGFQVKDRNLESIYAQIVEVRVGGEVMIPLTPIRVRAGLAYLPYGLEYLESDRIAPVNDEVPDATTLKEAEVEFPSQRLASVGAGILLGNVLTIDGALELMLGEREIPTLLDERERWRFVLGGAYRF